MKSLPNPIVAGVAAIALVGVAGLAVAEIKNTHVLDVRLADGSKVHIRYFGDTPPTVRFAPAPLTVPILLPDSDPFAPESPFMAIMRMSEAVDRQAEAIIQAARARPQAASAGQDKIQIDTESLAPTAHGASMVLTRSGGRVCTRTVEYRSWGDGRAPEVVTRVSGACQTDGQQPRSRAVALPVADHRSSHMPGQTV